MNWATLICDKRLGMEEFHDPRVHIRSDFQRDYDRMIFSSPSGDCRIRRRCSLCREVCFVHNRLTHSLEVSSVGRSLSREVVARLSGRYADGDVAESLASIPDIVAAACLCHDLGNPLRAFRRDDDINMVQRGAGLQLKGSLTRSNGRISSILKECQFFPSTDASVLRTP